MSIGFVICMPPLGVLPQFASYLARGLLVIVIVMNDVLQLDMSACLVEWNGYLELPLMHIKYSKAIHPSVCPSDHLSFNLSIPIPITLEPVVRMIDIVGAYIGDCERVREWALRGTCLLHLPFCTASLHVLLQLCNLDCFGLHHFEIWTLCFCFMGHSGNHSSICYISRFHLEARHIYLLYIWTDDGKVAIDWQGDNTLGIWGNF